MIKNVLIIGLGAVGAVFASKTQNCKDFNLYVLVDKKRYERYEKKQILINGKACEFNYAFPENYNNLIIDLIIIATKAYNLEDAINLIKNYVSDKTTIISLINGIESEYRLCEVYGEDKVVYSVLIGLSNRVKNEINYAENMTIHFGQHDGNIDTSRIASLKNYFDKIDMMCKITDNIKYTMWQKFMINVGFNQATALIGSDYRVIKSGEKTVEFATKLMKEVECLAIKAGIDNADEMLSKCLEITQSMPDCAKTSMLQDVESFRQVEAEIFSGTVCRLSKKYNVSVPYNAMVYELLTAINEKNKIINNISDN